MHEVESGHDTEAWALGRVISDRYVVGAVLGRGGMGTVYAAFDRDLGREVALKVLGSPHADDAQAVERFLRQARALAQVDHPGVVRVYDRALHLETPYVVMERLVGRDVRALLRERGRLPLTTAVAYLCELCEALAAVHAQAIIHRDLKPSNVFVSEHDGRQQLKLLDFGIAKLSSEPPLTAAQELLGTFAYMPPEQLDRGEVSVQGDVYALACLLYELLAGRPPFRARTRAELIAAIIHDSPPPLAAEVPGLPRELERFVLVNLEKDKRARATSARAFADTLRAIDAANGPTVRAPAPSPLPAALAGRYQLLRTLGEGSSGVVYAALDRQSGEHVALKRLRSVHADDVYRLKREFRTVAALAHPNLVRCFELSCEPGEAFFTMELIAGRPLSARCEEAPELLPVLVAQLVCGLAALHAQQLVHRDLKPSNVLVDERDRVVLLDFGLTVQASTRSWIAGTPRYMAPEASAGEIGPAADMYALGVILHELLTGHAPGEQPVSEPTPGAPGAELWAMCRALLAREPAQRPSAQLLAARLSPQPSAAGSDDTGKLGPSFIGREAELRSLRDALAETADGAPSLVLVRGESGIGKTALLAHLQRELGRSSLVLASACRDGESLPYPALDAAVDALADHLAGLLRSSLTPLLPRHIAALALLFPVLQRIDLPTRGELPRDPAEIRALAYGALQRLLARLAEQRPLVLIVDDVHWIDPDSAALLEYMLTRPDPPALLVVLAVRVDLESNASYAALRRALSLRSRTLTLAALPELEGRALVQAVLRDKSSPALLERIVAEGAGHPFLLTALAQQAQTQQLTAAGFGVADEAAQRLLELTCLCQRPLPLALIFAAHGGGERPRSAARAMNERPGSAARAINYAEQVRALTRARLCRRLQVAGRIALEPYHVRVRQAVLANMPEHARREGHRALAGVLARESEAWPEALAEHLFASGDKQEGARVATHAAEVAREQLAFDRASLLYDVALREGQPDAEQRVTWLLARASALRAAGRNVDAAEVLCEASSAELEPHASLHRRQAGELLLVAGEFERGLALLEPLLARAGLALPSDAQRAVAIGLAAFGELAQRGFERKPRAEPATARELERFALCAALANGMALIDARGLPFAIFALLEAFALDEPAALQSALATFVTLTAGLFYNPLLAPALALCRELTNVIGTPYARALLYAAEGEAAHFSAHFLQAEASFEQAERILLESCVGTSRELAAVRNGMVLLEYAQKGDFSSQLERTTGWQADAQARRDRFHENVLRIAHSIVWIAQDDPARARAELERAERAFQGGAGAFEVGMLEFWDVIDRYEGRLDVHLRPLQGRESVLHSPAAASPVLAGYIHLQRAWGAIRALADGHHRGGERALAENAIRALRALAPEIWQAVADAFEANLEFLESRRESALQLIQRAESTFRRLHMRCLAACARLRYGELSGGVFGARLVDEAQGELVQLGVRRPERWSRAYFSLFERERSSELTL